MTDKFKSACVEYEKQRAAIVSISKALQEQRIKCTSSQGFDDTVPDARDYCLDHLSMAYEMAPSSECEYGEVMAFVHHDGEVEDYLAELCPHCLAAHHLVQERKSAKKLFGIAKRRISALGRSA